MTIIIFIGDKVRIDHFDKWRGTIMTIPAHQELSRRLVDLYKQFPHVQAVALGGSLASGQAVDATSDVDLYVFTDALISLQERIALVEQAGGASRANMNLDYWDLGDEWFHAQTGIEVDVVYWDTQWIEDTLARVIRDHQASAGYSTAHWNTILQAQPLFDRAGWFAQLQESCRQPYPEELRQSVITRNLALLRDVIPSYLRQLEKALHRGDQVSINHRMAALLSSYFDVIFAFNRVLHPGEKRLVAHAQRLCAYLPEEMPEQVSRVLQLSGTLDPELIVAVNRLVDGLEAMVHSTD
jgi:hypothetical protein